MCVCVCVVYMYEHSGDGGGYVCGVLRKTKLAGEVVSCVVSDRGPLPTLHALRGFMDVPGWTVSPSDYIAVFTPLLLLKEAFHKAL